MRGYTCGLENFLALGHDFVLRRNLWIASKLPGWDFVASTFGSHYIALVDHIAQRWNTLFEAAKGKQRVVAGEVYREFPGLKEVQTNETFGLVFSHTSSSFGGRLKIKEEDTVQMMEYEPVHLHQGLTEDQLMKELNIDPALLQLPENEAPSKLISGLDHKLAVFTVENHPQTHKEHAVIVREFVIFLTYTRTLHSPFYDTIGSHECSRSGGRPPSLPITQSGQNKEKNKWRTYPWTFGVYSSALKAVTNK